MAGPILLWERSRGSVKVAGGERSDSFDTGPVLNLPWRPCLTTCFEGTEPVSDERVRKLQAITGVEELRPRFASFAVGIRETL